MRDGRLIPKDRAEPSGAIAILQIEDRTDVGVIGLYPAPALFGSQQ
ncbi:MAG: hypothetical protein AAGJ28_23155 [Pseudomonadota bacterium]